MTLREFINDCVTRLAPLYPAPEAKSIAFRLLEHFTDIPSYKYISEPDTPIDASLRADLPSASLKNARPTEDHPLRSALAELETGRPLQYVLGVTEFCGHRFTLNYDGLYYFFNQSKWRKLWAYVFRCPITTQYKAVLSDYDTSLIKADVYPTVYPNWDTTPRRGVIGTVFTGSTPELFEQHVRQIIDATQPNSDSDKVIFLKSWNEWAEGNYMEPDAEFGHQYIEALHKALYD